MVKQVEGLKSTQSRVYCRRIAVEVALVKIKSLLLRPYVSFTWIAGLFVLCVCPLGRLLAGQRV